MSDILEFLSSFSDKTCENIVNKKVFIMNEAFKFYKNKEKALDLRNVIDCTPKDDDKVQDQLH